MTLIRNAIQRCNFKCSLNNCLQCVVAYVIQVISVRVLHLFHNNSVEVQLIHLLPILLYNLLVSNYCYYWLPVQL